MALSLPQSPPPGFVALDAGRLWVAESSKSAFEAAGLTTFAAWFHLSSGEAVRQIGTRQTTRVNLATGTDPAGEIYLKRFGPLGWRERVKNWLSLKRPIHGAAPEFAAILRFRDLQIPTVEPLVFGQDRAGSLLVTRGLSGYRDLKELVQSQDPSLHPQNVRQQLAISLGDMTRRMHVAGLHHQDFYLNHILVDVRDGTPRDPRIIDLGRVGAQRHLARRWILKDLAQLAYSAQRVSPRDLVTFLRTYLGRPLLRSDRPWLRRIAAKARWIDAHTRRHGL